MFPEIKKSFYRFLIIYTISTMALVGIGEYLYYRFALHSLIDRQINVLNEKSHTLVKRIKSLHQSFAPRLEYPHIKGVQSALYDIEKNYIIGDFKPANVRWDKEFWIENDRIYKIFPIYPHYLGAAYLILAKPLDKEAILTLYKHLLYFTLFALLVVVLTAYILGKLFLKPAQRSMELLDGFIKDAAHELNTPISTIITNIELFKELNPGFGSDEELKRIELASKKLNKIFNDLAFIQLNHRIKRDIKPVRADKTVKERIEYFSHLLKSKDIKLNIYTEPVTLHIDPADLETLIDNLLSNAIKYNKESGNLNITLTKEHLLIEDTGIGIHKGDLDKITKRFFRSKSAEGGFGLGLFIVRELSGLYGFKLDIQSDKDIGTKVEIKWQKE